MTKRSLVFEESHRGHSVKAWYLAPPDDQNALLEFTAPDGQIFQRFYPAYRVWNISAHFGEMIDAQMERTS